MSSEPDTPHSASPKITPTETYASSETEPGRQIGPYKVLQRIGAGGMGEVWVAEQAKPVKRRVALKLIKMGISSREIVARFESERQALSMMNHPNIARILDAGAMPDGRPYFVMELVAGKPLSTYCDENKLSIEQRLKMFMDVCSGVQHAHQKGIIHRDLKPGNILVTVQDGVPVPKIIDFGLAKAMESTQRLTDESLFTVIGQILGTLKYMSPEQASLDSLDIDTRTDIYALGVILYELLTGSTPLDDASLQGQAALKILEFIREKEPAKPSSKLASSTNEQVSSITGRRQTDGVRLKRILLGDLDWIVMKALEKDRTRRYESASGFAADIRRYLSNEPVIARPPSLNYRIRKFVRKNRIGVLAAALVLLTLVGGIVGTSWALFRALAAEKLAEERLAQTDQAREEEAQQRKLADERRHEAEQNLAFAKKGNEILGSVFTGLDPKAEYARVADLRNALRDNLEKAVEELQGAAIGDALQVADMQMTLGHSLFGLGQADQAVTVFERAVNTYREQLGPDHLSTLISTSNLAAGYQLAGRPGQALPLIEQTLPQIESKLGPDHTETLSGMHNLASGYLDVGQFDKALPLFEQILKLSTAKLGNDHSVTLTFKNSLADCYRQAGQRDQALPLLEQTLELQKSILGPDHPDTLISMGNLAMVYQEFGQFDKALPLFEQTVKLNTSKLGLDHPTTLRSMNNLATGYQSAGRLDQALPLYEQTLELMKSEMGPNHPSFLTGMSNLAGVYREAGLLDRALPIYEQTFELLKSKRGPDHPETLSSMHNLAARYLNLGQLDKALPLFEQTLELSKAKLGADHPKTLTYMNGLAECYHRAGQLDQAVPLLEQTLEMSKTKLGLDHPNLLVSTNNLAMIYKTLGQSNKALQLLENTLDLQKTKLGTDHPSTLTTMNNLAMIYQDFGQLDQAVLLYERTLELMKTKLGPNHPDWLTSMNNLATIYQKTGRLVQALPLYERTFELQKASLGRDHPDTLNTMSNLGLGYQAAGRLDQALPLLEQSLEFRKVKLGSDHPLTLTSMNNLATCYWKLKMLDLSIPLFEQTLDLQSKKLGRDHPNSQATLANLGVNLRDAGRVEDAIPLLEEAFESSKQFRQLAFVRGQLRSAYARGKRVEPFNKLASEDLAAARDAHAPGSAELAAVLVAVGNEYLILGEHQSARDLLSEGYNIRRQVAPDQWNTFNAQSLLGGALLAQAKAIPIDGDAEDRAKLLTDAEPLLLAGYEGLKQRASTLPPQAASFIQESLDRLIELYTVWGKDAEVLKYRQQLAPDLGPNPANHQ